MINKNAIQNISKLDPFKRYLYFIKKVADFEELWVLVNANQDIAFSTIGNEVVISLWSAKEFTESCRKGIWELYQAKKVTLRDFDKLVLPFIEAQKALIDVFPVEDKSGFVVSYEEFKRDLGVELENY